MKILLINKFYHDTGKAGGVGRYILELKKLLEKNRHEVVPFACRDKDVLPSSYTKFFPSYQDLEKLSADGNPFSKISAKSKALRNVFYNTEARKKLSRLCDKENFDIAHINNIYHHLSPSVLFELKDRNIPIVQTIHDYHLISPNYNLFYNGEIHEECAGSKAFKAPLHHCVQGSRAASLIAALRIYYLRALQPYKKNIDLFIAPSEFLRKKHIDYGFKPKAIHTIPNFLDSSDYSPRSGSGEYLVYSGRLSPEKGILKLVKAMQKNPEERLLICGDGEQKKQITQLIKNKSIENVKLLGHKPKKELFFLIRKAKATIVPSQWYENCPYSVLESYALGVPVISSKLGGLSEIVKNKKTGLTFRHDSGQALSSKIKKISQNKKLNIRLGKEARKYLKINYSPESHYQKLSRAYKKVLKATNY